VKSEYNPNNVYYKESNETNNAVFLNDGFVSTGDMGFIDKKGFLYINGRIKDIIILSNGRKIFPNSIEEKINSSKLIKRSVIYGNDKPYLTALIIPYSSATTYKTLKEHFKFINHTLATHERIMDIIVLYEDFSVQNEMLNSGLKLNRKVIAKKYKDKFEELYIQ
jgi:long-chain acyl-CoA synthetase